jgi:hypothetical protein
LVSSLLRLRGVSTIVDCHISPSLIAFSFPSFVGGVALVRVIHWSRYRFLITPLQQMRHALIRFLSALDVDVAWYVTLCLVPTRDRFHLRKRMLICDL